MADNKNKLLEDFVKKYTDITQAGFDERWKQITPDIYEKHMHECIGALLARQATLSIEMAMSPSTWNPHVAPLFLRCMIDAYITLAWILEDPRERSEEYIHYGLGQEKLYIEYLKESLDEDLDSYDAEGIKNLIEMRESWLNNQLAEWATEVNVGSWSGISTREMAKQIGRESIYKHAYVPFSGSAHNMWQHVGIFNIKPCNNPLHKGHVVPTIRGISPHPDFMYRSAKYISITFELFDEKMGIKCEVPLPDDFLIDHPLFTGKEEDS